MIEEKKLLIDGLEINYKTAGSGPAILILHGWGGSSDSWAKVQESLSTEFKVICPDLPGFGKTNTPALPWKLNDYLDFVLKFSSEIGMDKFILIAHSFGGRISIKLAAEHPDKIIKMVLTAPAGLKVRPNLKTKVIFLIAAAGNIIFSLKPLRVFKNWTRDLFYFFIRKGDYAKANETMKETMKNVLSEDLLSYLNQIKTKTLIIWGKKDKMVPLEHAYILHRSIENSELRIFDKVGHSPHLEVPERLINIIKSFIQ